MSENLVMAENYTLPSLGKVYEKEINPEIKLRSMTTNEEMLRLSPSERAYKVLAEIIDDCLLTKLPISAYDLCIGDFQYCLHKLRTVTYGPEYKTVSGCPFCGTQNARTINLDELSWKTYSEDINRLFEFDLPISNKHIKVKVQTPRILDEISVKSKDLKKAAGGKSGDPALLFTLVECIAEVDREKPNPIFINQFIRELPMKDTNYILNHIQKINESIGLDTQLEQECELCGLAYTSTFRITSEFFGPSVDF